MKNKRKFLIIFSDAIMNEMDKTNVYTLDIQKKNYKD